MQSKNDRIIIVGAFPEVIELAEECGKHIVGLIAPGPRGEQHGYPVLGDDPDADQLHAEHCGVPVFVGIDEPARRARLVAHYTKAGFDFTNLVHPQAKISRSATLGVGVMIQYGVYLSANARLGNFVRLNVYANLMHDVEVGDYTTIAPNALVLGRVRIGQRCYVGAHSTVMPDLEIGDGSCVGAQANVTKSVAPGCVVVGNPARPQQP